MKRKITATFFQFNPACFSLKTKYLVETFLATTFKEITNLDDE